jgi:hypothetical protein
MAVVKSQPGMTPNFGIALRSKHLQRKEFINHDSFNKSSDFEVLMGW